MIGVGVPYKNQEHALRTLYTQFAFVLHSFCALVNHILHMCKMCVTSKILGTCAKCAQEVYIAICVQFAHNPQDMCKICAVCAQSSRCVHNMCSLRTNEKKKKKKKVQHRLLVTRPSTGQAQCSSTGAFNVVWSQTPTAIQEDLLYVQLHCLK